MASYTAPKNKLREQREAVLGITMSELVERARQSKILLTTRTISRVESGSGQFTRVTFSRLLLAINVARSERKLKPISEADLFPVIKESRQIEQKPTRVKDTPVHSRPSSEDPIDQIEEPVNDEFSITFDDSVSPDQVERTLTALANYYRACGGVGLPAEFEGQEMLVDEDVHV